MTDDWVGVALEEYKTLRQESLAAIEQMQRTLQIGLVAIGVLTGFGVDAVNEGAGAQAGLAIFTPVVAALVIALRLDELLRAVRAGAHIALLERRIAARTDPDQPPLTWESSIQEDFVASDDKIRHGVTSLTLFVVSAPAVVLATVELAQEQPAWAPVAVVLAVLLIAFLTAVYQRYMLGRVAACHLDAKHALGAGK
jgi:hypothetical protein